MKERGIIFKGWGVRAIRNMKPDVWPAEAIDPSKPMKWQTRRVMNPQPRTDAPGDWYLDAYDGGPQWNWWDQQGRVANTEPFWRCPYGVPGDVLWVRERAKIIDREFDARSGYSWFRSQGVGEDTWEWQVENGRLYDDAKQRWKRIKTERLPFYVPSIHMFREASREDLLLKEVRVERIRDISIADVRAEGMSFEMIDDFPDVWDEINEKRGFGWEANPWVWVLSFMRKAK